MHAESFQQTANIGNSRSRFFVSLKSKKRIDALFKSGGKVFGKNLMLRFNRSNSGIQAELAIPVSSTEVNPPFHVVFAVATKLGDAHVRNRIKRRLREALHALFQQGAVKRAGFDLAVVPRKETADLAFVDLCSDLKMALERLPKRMEARGVAAATEGGLRSTPKGTPKQ